MNSADLNAILGLGSPSDYDLLTGGLYADSQDPYTAIDNGTVNNANTGTGNASANGTIKPPAGGSSYTPPNWLSGLLGLTSSAGALATQLSPIIGGKPAASPSQAGQQPTGAAKTVSIGGSKVSWPIIAGVVVAVVVAVLFFWKRKRR